MTCKAKPTASNQDYMACSKCCVIGHRGAFTCQDTLMPLWFKVFLGVLLATAIVASALTVCSYPA